MRTIAVLPVKSFPRAKQRIRAAVEPQAREALAEAMVSDVLDALLGVPGLETIVVVTAEERARRLAEQAGAIVVPDRVEAGQSAAAMAGVGEAVRRGAERVLLVPGDCPALDPAEVSALLDPEADGVLIVPDRHGAGTNALLLAPPDVMAPSFGPGSFARHAATARAAGTRVRVATVPTLGLDIDTPGDLAELRATLALRPAGANRTRGVLQGLVDSQPARAHG